MVHDTCSSPSCQLCAEPVQRPSDARITSVPGAFTRRRCRAEVKCSAQQESDCGTCPLAFPSLSMMKRYEHHLP